MLNRFKAKIETQRGADGSTVTREGRVAFASISSEKSGIEIEVNAMPRPNGYDPSSMSTLTGGC